MSARAPIVDRIRIIPRPNDFLDRNVGSSGELFFDRDNKTVRVYDGDNRGGFEVVTQENISKSTSLQGVSSYRYDVTVVGPQPGDTGNKYVLNGEYRPELTLVIGYSYVFDQNDPTNVYYPNPTGSTPNPHPLNFSSTGPNGPLYTDNVIYYMDGREVTQQKYIDDFNTAVDKKVIITITKDTPTTLYYYCSSHANMGNTITTSVPGTGSGAQVFVASNQPDVDDDGSLWYDSDDGSLYVYVETSSQWELINDSPAQQNTFTTFSVKDNDSSTIISTQADDTFVFEEGEGVELLVDPSTNTLKISAIVEPDLLDEKIADAITDLDLSIDALNDVNTTSTPPSTGSVLKWDGAKWAPGIDVTVGIDSGNADTLDGFDGSYYLNYNNLNNLPNRFLNVLVSGQSNIIADSNNDSLVFAGGQNITLTTNPTTDTLTIATDIPIPTDINQLADVDGNIPTALTDLGIVDGTDGQVLTTDGAGSFTFTTVSGGGGGADQNLFATIASDNGSTTANTTTDTLTVSGGTNIGTSITNDELTINFTGSVPSNANELTDVSNASINVSDFFESAIVTLRVDNNGTSSYLFNSHYSGGNPTLYVLSGTTVAFDLGAAGGHPFEIQDGTLSPISDGLVHVSDTGVVSTGSSAQGKDSGVLYWRIQESISGTYAYQCQSHAAMVGNIVIKRLSII